MDAALCLPVFLIAMALLLLLMMQAGTEETVVRAAAVSCHACIETGAAEKAVDTGDAGGVILAGVYAGRLYGYLGREWEKGPSVMITHFRTGQTAMASGNIRIDRLVRTGVTSRRKALFALGKTDGILSLRSFVFRPWEGESHQLLEFSGERVYVFPKYGERYHSYGCRIMKEGSVEEILTESLKRRCNACKVCKPGSQTYGSLVFLFSDGSRVYHRKECSSITKYYVSMPLEEAQADGYTPCLFCRGGE